MKQLKAFGQVVVGLLRELADENAYQRHLAAHGRPHSPEEWRKFSEERLRAKYQRPKCC
jgi:predicted secreted acid phosphatase